jgi:hypothetical protein
VGSWLGVSNRSIAFQTLIGSGAIVETSDSPSGSGTPGAGGATQVFNFASGFAGAGSVINVHGNSALNGSVIKMQNVTGHSACGVFYTTKQAPGSFTTQFTFQPSGLTASPVESGFTFCVQNTVSPPGAAGFVGVGYQGDANMCGYSDPGQPGTSPLPPLDSICVKFDASNVGSTQSLAGALPSTTGLYLNGGPVIGQGGNLGLVPFNDLAPSGINFYAGNIHQATIVYDDTLHLLTLVVIDTVTSAQARMQWPLNLANTTNATGNFVGFTAGGATVGAWTLSSWNYSTGFNTRLATPTFSPAPGQYSGTQSVSLSGPSGTSIYYTTNGLLPTSSDTLWIGTPISISSNEVIQAVAIASGFTDSVVATGAYQINTANQINFPSGFALGNLITAGYSYLSGSAIRVSDTTTATSGGAWFPVPIDITSFSTAFTLQWSAGSNANGMCFVIQNNPAPYTSLSNSQNVPGGPTVVSCGVGTGLGYGGIGAGTAQGIRNSLAIAFDLFAVSNSVGLYTDGATPTGSQIATGLTFSGNSFNVTLSYSGTTLVMTMQKTSGGTTFSHTFVGINIPALVGGNLAYLGFTGATGGATAIQSITKWVGP